ncbi:MAG TPA: tyrosinase family protein [Thermoleophilaceae bacterium]
MALGDGIRRNVAAVDPSERALLRDAFIELNNRTYTGSRADTVPGGVTWWFKQDEIHQATHVHNGPEFLSWHREIVNRLEALLREINPQLSLHYWDWTQDPRAIPNANLGGGTTGTLNLFTPDFMGYGGATSAPIGEPWLSAGYYVPGAALARDSTGNPADPPAVVNRHVSGSPASATEDAGLIGENDFAGMRVRLENVHNAMHGFVSMGGQHISFRDPFVFLLHSNVDRLFAMWQTQPAHPEHLDPGLVYGSESADPGLNANIEPWSTGHSFDAFGVEHFTRPWFAPENEGVPKTYKHPTVVTPPCYDTLPTTVTKIAPAGSSPMRFIDVPTGSTTARALRLEVRGCAPVHVSGVLTGDAAFTLHQAAVVSPDPHGFQTETTFMWVKYTGGPPGSTANGHLTATCSETGEVFEVDVVANAITKPTVAVSAVLDSSGSMAAPSGVPGLDRMAVLHQAAPTFLALLDDDDGIGVVRFDTDATPVSPVALAGPLGSGGGRDNAAAAVNAHATNPLGLTAIGDGIEAAHNQLVASPPGFAHQAILVFTDGEETTSKYISDVTSLINERVFAVGLGTPDQLSPTGLSAITQGTGGYLTLTGPLGTDGVMRLAKYFSQVLAGVTNAQIVTDPTGFAAPGLTEQVPFALTEADRRCDVILLTEAPSVLKLTVAAPSGTTIGAGPDATPLDAPAMKCLRIVLPLSSDPAVHGGSWIANIKVDRRALRRYLAALEKRGDVTGLQRASAHGIAYTLTVQAVSDLRMAVTTLQNGYDPGSAVDVIASLTDSGIPLAHQATVRVQVTMPDGTVHDIPLGEDDPGTYRATVALPQLGHYPLLVNASGRALDGSPFTREELRSAATWRDRTPPPRRPCDHIPWCELMLCLLRDDRAGRALAERGVNLEGARECIERLCRRHA